MHFLFSRLNLDINSSLFDMRWYEKINIYFFFLNFFFQFCWYSSNWLMIEIDALIELFCCIFMYLDITRLICFAFYFPSFVFIHFFLFWKTCKKNLNFSFLSLQVLHKIAWFDRNPVNHFTIEHTAHLYIKPKRRHGTYSIPIINQLETKHFINTNSNPKMRRETYTWFPMFERLFL